MEEIEKHFSGNIGQKAVIKKGDTFLVCRGIADSWWSFPGGRLHKDETPIEGLLREVKEEVGMDVAVLRPIHVCRAYHYKSQVWQVTIGYECTLINDTQQKIDSSEIEEIDWVSKEKLKSLTMFEDCREIADVYLKS